MRVCSSRYCGRRRNSFGRQCLCRQSASAGGWSSLGVDKCNLHRRHSGSVSTFITFGWGCGVLHIKSDYFSFGFIAVGVPVAGCVEEILDPANVFIPLYRLSAFR